MKLVRGMWYVNLLPWLWNGLWTRAKTKHLTPQVARHAESTGDRGVRVAVAIALQRQRGSGFDRLTRTKTAAKLLQVLWTRIRSMRLLWRHIPSKHLCWYGLAWQAKGVSVGLQPAGLGT